LRSRFHVHVLNDLSVCEFLLKENKLTSGDFSGRGIYGFSGERWNPETDARGFASVLSEVVVGGPASDEAAVPADVPMFVSATIKARLSGESRRRSSFGNVFETRKRHDFGSVAGADSAEVVGFVGWVEFLEHFRESHPS
jgi:hypothetical protein